MQSHTKAKHERGHTNIPGKQNLKIDSPCLSVEGQTSSRSWPPAPPPLLLLHYDPDVLDSLETRKNFEKLSEKLSS